jgi:hypothetical protein
MSVPKIDQPCSVEVTERSQNEMANVAMMRCDVAYGLIVPLAIVDNLAYPVAMAIAPALESARAYDMMTEELQAAGDAGLELRLPDMGESAARRGLRVSPTPRPRLRKSRVRRVIEAEFGCVCRRVSASSRTSMVTTGDSAVIVIHCPGDPTALAQAFPSHWDRQA